MYGDYGTFLRLNKKSSDYLEKNYCKLCLTTDVIQTLKQKLKIMFMKD